MIFMNGPSAANLVTFPVEAMDKLITQNKELRIGGENNRTSYHHSWKCDQ